MKLAFLSSTLAFLAGSASAFAPQPRAVVAFTMPSTIPRTALFMASEDQTLEEEVEEMVQAEVNKSKRMSNMRNANGVEYAPWMNISKEDEERIRKNAMDKAESRRRRRVESENVQGELLRDSAFQEMSGSGLKGKVVDGNCVELEWATDKERNTKGFLVKRRQAKTEKFEVIASHETYGPLASKGPDGGLYRYMDEDVGLGGWVYRVTECDIGGKENDLSQCLVELQTVDEQRSTVLAAAALGVVAIAVVAASIVLDPMQY
jgi:hypothetical protein